MNDKQFSNDAKQIVDLIFESKMLRKNITRDEMNTFEELINFLLSSRFESYKRVESLLKRSEEIHASKENKA